MITGRPMAAVTRTVAVGTVGVTATDVMVVPARAAVTRLGAQGRAAFRCDEEAVGSARLRNALLRHGQRTAGGARSADVRTMGLLLDEERLGGAVGDAGQRSRGNVGAGHAQSFGGRRVRRRGRHQHGARGLGVHDDDQHVLALWRRHVSRRGRHAAGACALGRGNVVGLLGMAQPLAFGVAEALVALPLLHALGHGAPAGVLVVEPGDAPLFGRHVGPFEDAAAGTLALCLGQLLHPVGKGQP